VYGAGAVEPGVGAAEWIRGFGVGETDAAAGLVGLFLGAAETCGGSYRSIWRYTSLSDVITIGLSSAALLGGLLALRSLGVVDLSAATLLLMALLMLFLCVGVRTLRRWSVAEARQRDR